MKERFIELINRLPRDEDMVPYDYHHHYVRQNVHDLLFHKIEGIGELKRHTDDELYACCLMNILEHNRTEAFRYITGVKDIITIKKAMEISENYLKTKFDIDEEQSNI